MKPPFFSVVINCYNGEEFLSEALASVLNQSFDDFEIVFWDNCSTDNSKYILDTFNDSRIKYYSSSVNTSLGEARNEAVKACIGEWITFLDVDDLWFEKKLEIQHTLIGSLNDDYCLIYSGVEEVDSQLNHIRFDLPKKHGDVSTSTLLNEFDINMVTPAIRRTFLIENNINFNTRIKASEEYNLFLRLSLLGKVFATDDILGKYRSYEESLTNKHIEQWYYERMITILDMFELSPGDFIENPSYYIKAIERGIYYKARYMASCNKTRELKALMKFLRYRSKSYFFLYLISHNLSFWNLIHNRKIKSILTNIIMR
ncbi:glycosyltransferase family 2 protein [Vibrio sinaloensis]|uniref:glycosyltransferase family 2 protein n=1 Tax=Photobacterium sp. (strain ATCC 43367) TaxID=379097 RepID=UPI002047CC7B|nr:glycosyltransferase family 2 protein [Vibrio sinaloensis]UPQ88126.1 glycosyltransferase family 2 protein [Vibrio sinaloensis]